MPGRRGGRRSDHAHRLIDDRWGLDALTKFAGQITAASVLVTSMGVAWSVLYIPIGGVGNAIVLDQASSILATLALTVSIVNAMNFVDGPGRPRNRARPHHRVAICMFSVGLLRDHGGDVLFYPPAVISVVAGACLGFLPHNFHPARIFGVIPVHVHRADARRRRRPPRRAPSPRTPTARATIFALLSPFLLVVAVMLVPSIRCWPSSVAPRRPQPVSPEQDASAIGCCRSGHSHRRVAAHLPVGRHHRGWCASTIFFDPPVHAVR